MAKTAPKMTPLDRATATLVRLVLAPDWDPAAASRDLVRSVSDERVLQQVGLRVKRALAHRHSEVAERAAMTLQAAGQVWLSIGPPLADSSTPMPDSPSWSA